MNKKLIFQTTHSIKNAQNDDAKLKSLWNFCGDAGIDNFSFVSSRLSLTNAAPDVKRLDGFPSAWRQRYDEMDYQASDLAMDHCRNNIAPLQWMNPDLKLDKINKKIYTEAAEFGIVSGISYPFHGINGENAIFSATVSSSFKDSPLKSLTTQYGLYLIGSTLFDIQRSTEQGELANVLSKREKECLRWAADGKTAWEIAKILKISERTAVFHFENARKKLSTASRIETVSKALLMSIL
ncbi:MAG: LuxR family transcriptional activator of bioluminescence operon [Parvicella sp.]|jgi:LuxR family transcriptional activator of bioluminescence operon